MIYLCLTRPCVVAELTTQAAPQSITVDDLLPPELWSLTMQLDGVLDLTSRATLTKLGLETADLTAADHALTQRIDEAAHDAATRRSDHRPQPESMRSSPSSRRTSEP